MIISITLAALGYTGLMAMYKVAKVAKCEYSVFLGGLFGIGAVSSGLGIAAAGSNLQAPLFVWLMGTAAGVLGVLTIVCLFRALGLGGNLALVNVFTSLSIVVPIVFALLFLGENLNLLRAAGLGLFVLFVVLINEPGANGEGTQ